MVSIHKSEEVRKTLISYFAFLLIEVVMLSLLVGALLFGRWPETSVQLPENPRIAWVGPTWIEREQEFSYWETALHQINPGKRIVFRNLGWSGDTVFGEARAGFGSVEDGYKGLLSQVRDSKPNIIILGYGFNESFAGKAGLTAFKKQYTRLIGDLKPLGAAIFLTGVPPVVNRPPELVSAETLLENGGLYTKTIREIAKEQGIGFLNVEALKASKPTHTANGIHLRPEGYRDLAGPWVQALGLGGDAKPFQVSIDASARDAQRAVVDKFTANSAGGWDFSLKADRLPLAGGASGVVAFANLREGNWELRQGDKVVHKASAADWAKGQTVALPGDQAQAEELRKEVARKNREFFYRWRPQNETYLFGFRKHEQGQNAREIPQFDPIVEESEKRMVQLSQPKFHEFQLVPGN